MTKKINQIYADKYIMQKFFNMNINDVTFCFTSINEI